MLRKYYPSAESFSRFEKTLLSLGFRRIERVEVSADFKRFGLVAPRKRPGRELGFRFDANALTVVVWTSWLPAEEAIREEDSGWILIKEGDNPRYFVHPLMRTKGFLLRLARHAWVARQRALKRPLCTKCKQFMEIKYGRALKSRYWGCFRLKDHEDSGPDFCDWDYGLGPRAKEFLKEERAPKRRYRQELKRQRKLVTPAVLRRRSWRKTRIVGQT